MIFLVLSAIVILGVIAFNMYQENKYRQQVRAQFGHSDKDALLEKQTRSVRDGRLPGHQAKSAPAKKLREKDISELPNEDMFDQMAAEAAKAERKAHAARSRKLMEAHGDEEIEMEEDEFGAAFSLDLDKELEKESKAGSGFKFQKVAAPAPSQTKVKNKKELLLDLDDMVRQQLPWFNHNFDYMAYLSLKEPQELHVLPRFAGRHRFQVAGCTMDDRWQIAEPIPSVYYQGFVVGLQSISRNGLATTQELERFGEQVNHFAEQLDAGLLLMDVNAFLKNARPLDELCERVDQTIAMHLVSRGSVSGTELRAAVEKEGFSLGHDGMFHLPDGKGEPLFSIVTLDSNPFTASLLASQAYRGFSMLFDITRVPAGEKHFNRFMDIAVNLSGSLGLDLVDDNMNELSPEWLKNVRSFVLARQEEMKKVGIEPGGDLAARLFA
ncbi:MAG: cell division protein ZipA C-terminal FtsZ-binding domain-containing protein [Neisseria sp.]|uniref:cell division protein ZipA C-terminal FtsZ-binding domain-containing protein n=1 Tax=Neisseria sp. TaxID=192066 RepID=UPI0026DC65BF|nr:cell division protein ZipA C-terminal FtsZ-binding domain-containing protein [Neisseria sp.]MDO4640312.1 cell division protein ZipA C-terminal FtsZ-binding domain-containing protein [Neisseria sp.]